MKKLSLLTLLLILIACKPHGNKNIVALAMPDTAAFDTTLDGKSVKLFMLENKNGMKVFVTNYGARIVAVYAPDKNGTISDIALGYSSIKGYLNDNMFLGPTVGRFANRIKAASFKLDGNTYTLNKNDGNNTLHGGFQGFDKRVWAASQDSNTLNLTYLSPDGEEGYPGNLIVKQCITLTPDNEIRIEYDAYTDKPTIINLTNHTYFNLKGDGDTTILDHYIQIVADEYTPVDSEWIPTGEIASVENTPFDFRMGKQVGQDINADNQQLKNGKGYDHNWVVKKDTAGTLSMVAKVWENTSGRQIEYYSTEPGVQFYCGNFMNGTVTGKSGKLYQYRSGLLFEPQHFPDSPNHANFPPTLLNPGEKYHHLMILKFGIMK
jgi:aldose 1-epimerase